MLSPLTKPASWLFNRTNGRPISTGSAQRPFAGVKGVIAALGISFVSCSMKGDAVGEGTPVPDTAQEIVDDWATKAGAPESDLSAPGVVDSDADDGLSEPVTDSGPDLESMTKRELLDWAQIKGVAALKSHTKAEIIEALVSASSL